MAIRNALIRGIESEREQLEGSFQRLITLYAAARHEGYDHAPEDLLEAAKLMDGQVRNLLDDARDDLTE